MQRILIIEDNPMIVKSLEFKLSKDGYHVVTAIDGREAMNILGEQSFDLVLTDLMLPFVTGNQLIKHIKESSPETSIIVLSTSKQEKTIMEAFNFGVDDFITKPFNPNELTLRVKRSLKKI
ncbi:two-component system, OmpR family, response regulator VicR [Gillisia sp. Hel1_33_143]|uniref:response regulator transcription factor n=1 Tax=unclassified Gillisia TaxID=2615025 RepID=UPI000556DAAF|nr:MULTISPECIES: response regulator [unclassified Gillisia]SDS18731.1 two-component system, OmpR family, response regulator VicR [Gillisia sp. Hel1_33_143]